MRELKHNELKQVSGGDNKFMTETSTKGGGGNPQGGGVGLVTTTTNNGGNTVNGQKFRDDVPPPG